MLKARIAVVVLLFVTASCSLFYPSARTDTSPIGIQSAIRREFDADRAMEDLRTFAQHWRIPGSPAYDSCLAWIESRLQSTLKPSRDGGPLFSIQTFGDTARLTVWVPENAVLSMESPEQFVLHDYASTPVMLCENSYPADVTAPLVYVPGGDADEHYSQFEVKGCLVLCDAPASRSYRKAFERGALGVISRFVPPYNKPSEHPDIIAESGIPYDPQRKPFAVNISPRTAQNLKLRLRAGPVTLRVQINSTFIQSRIKNLQAEIAGAANPDERVVLVAHVDHYKPGAHDNASGSATLLEIARSLGLAIERGTLSRPARTLTFLWVDEYRGTNSWINADSGRLRNVLAAFALDMVGGDPEKTGGQFRVERMPDPGTVWMRPPDRHSGWGTGSWDKSKLFGSFLNDYFLGIIHAQAATTGWKTAENVWEGGSDHDPFLWKGVPAVLSWHFPDFAYHTSMDSVGNISPREVFNAGTSLASAAYLLALGSEDVARMALRSIDTARVQRLETVKMMMDMELSEVQFSESPAREAARKRETQILEAWYRWYDQVFKSVLRIPAGRPAEPLRAEIRARREMNQQDLIRIKAAFGL